MLKYISIFSCLYFLCFSKEFLATPTNLGESCGSTGVFTVVTATILPWPPTIGGQATCYLEGTFSEPTYVQQFIIGMSYNNMFWDYYPYDYDVTYNAGLPLAEFVKPITMWNMHGSYTVTMTLTSGVHIFCWSISFQL